MKNRFDINKLLTRCCHVLITTSIASIILSQPTSIHVQLNEKQLLLPLLYIFSTILSLVLYFTVAFMDPGFVKKEDIDIEELRYVPSRQPIQKEDDDVSSVDELYPDEGETVALCKSNSYMSASNNKVVEDGEDMENCFNLKPDERCGLCALKKPMRAKHCRECKRCVRKFDHHCPWITNCVGERNHRWFYVFLVFEIFLVAWSFLISITGYVMPGDRRMWMRENLWLILADALLVIFGFVVVALFCVHTYMLLSNNTTWESVSRHRISYLKNVNNNPFNLGCCKNAYYFLCYFKPKDWTIVYSKSQKKSSDNSNQGHSHQIDDL